MNYPTQISRQTLRDLHQTPAKCPLWVKSRHVRRKSDVRFAPNSDRESGFPQTVMSALPPKADMCGAARDVRFGPIADIPAITR